MQEQADPAKNHKHSTWQTSANTIRLGLQDKETEQVQLYNIGSSRAKPAPTITVQISSSTGMKDVKVLPDSGADISAAGQEVMRHLGQHKDNYCLPESALEQ